MNAGKAKLTFIVFAGIFGVVLAFTRLPNDLPSSDGESIVAEVTRKQEPARPVVAVLPSTATREGDGLAAAVGEIDVLTAQSIDYRMHNRVLPGFPGTTSETYPFMSMEELRTLAENRDVAAMHFYAAKLAAKGEIDASLRWYNEAAIGGASASLWSASRVLLAQADKGDEDARGSLMSEAYILAVTALLLGHGEYMTSLTETRRAAGPAGTSPAVCEQATHLLEDLQRERTDRGLPRYETVEVSRVIRALTEAGVCA